MEQPFEWLSWDPLIYCWPGVDCGDAISLVGAIATALAAWAAISIPEKVRRAERRDRSQAAGERYADIVEQIGRRAETAYRSEIFQTSFIFSEQDELEAIKAAFFDLDPEARQMLLSIEKGLQYLNAKGRWEIKRLDQLRKNEVTPSIYRPHVPVTHHPETQLDYAALAVLACAFCEHVAVESPIHSEAWHYRIYATRQRAEKFSDNLGGPVDKSMLNAAKLGRHKPRAWFKQPWDDVNHLRRVIAWRLLRQRAQRFLSGLVARCRK